MSSPDQNSDAEEIDPDNMNTEDPHHELYFGKAKFPVTANTEHIITEMGKNGFAARRTSKAHLPSSVEH